MTSQISELERIRTTLVDLCFEQGYRNVELSALLARAAVEEADFHRHFADLEDCFCDVYTRERDRMLTGLAAACIGQEDWRARLRAVAYALFRRLDGDEKVARLVMIEVRTAGERAQILMGEGIEAMLDLVDAGRGERGDSGTVSRTTAVSVVGGIFNQLYTTVGQGAPLREDAVPQMMYTAVLPYVGPEAALEELGIPPPPPDPES